MTDATGKLGSKKPTEWVYIASIQRIGRLADKTLDLLVDAFEELDAILYEIYKVENH